jgi:hypothetical protein
MKRWGFFVLAPAILIGCVVESRGHSTSNNNNNNNVTNPPPTNNGQPLLAVISTDKTMTAVGGDGVGVFVEYKHGGTWHVWWTCDSNKSAQSCNFDVKISSSSGPVQNLQKDRLLATDQANINADGSLEATTSTGANVAGVFFDTTAGARITLEATVGGVAKTGDYLFFVAQNSKGEDTVNGDYMGVLTNPLMLEPSSP